MLVWDSGEFEPLESLECECVMSAEEEDNLKKLSGEGEWLEVLLVGSLMERDVRSGVIRVLNSAVVSVVVVPVSSIVARVLAMGSSEIIRTSGVQGVGGGKVGSFTDEFTFRIGGMTGVEYIGLSFRSCSAFLKMRPMFMILMMKSTAMAIAPYFK